MDWLPRALAHLRDELARAQEDEKARDVELTLAQSAAEDATARVADLERAIYALQQLDPITRAPEVPL
jgi:hypothetical protein